MLTFRSQQESLNSTHTNLPIGLFFYNLCYYTKHLLESAKCAVEIAIEQCEQAAIDWSHISLDFFLILTIMHLKKGVFGTCF